MPCTVLSLDLGTNLGWCFSEDGKVVASGVYVLKNNSLGERWTDFHNWLSDFVGVTEIVYEEVPISGVGKIKDKDGKKVPRGMAQARVYFGLMAMLEIFVRTSSPKPHITPYHLGTLKKVFTGHGNATKADMCKKCHQLGWKGGRVGTDNQNDEADAIALQFVHAWSNQRKMSIV